MDLQDEARKASHSAPSSSEDDETNRSDVESTLNKNNSNCNIYNWSPHYSDGDYENQMDCPRLQRAYSNFSENSSD